MVREGKRIMKEGGWGKREEESDGERRRSRGSGKMKVIGRRVLTMVELRYSIFSFNSGDLMFG